MKISTTLALTLLTISVGAPFVEATPAIKGTISCEKGIAAQYSFSCMPRVIKVGGSSTQITLAAILTAPQSHPGAEVVATYKNGRTTFAYSSPMKKFMKQQGLKTSDFKPLESYLQKEITNAKKNPSYYVSLLDAYLKLGSTQPYQVDVTL